MRSYPKISLLAAAGLLLAACSSVAGPDPVRRVEAGTPFPLALGETVHLPDGGRLRYARLVGDSRCPPKVQCIWAGEVVVELEATAPGAAPASFELHSLREPRSRRIGAWRLELESVAPGIQPAVVLVLQDATPAP